MRDSSIIRRARAIVTTAACFVLACSRSEAPTEGAPAEATIDLSVATSGVDLDPDGYTIVSGEGDRYPLGASSTKRIAAKPGSRSFTLTGLSSNCVAPTGASWSGTVTAGEHVTVAFQVQCEYDQVAFESNRSGTNRVYVMRRDGSALTEITAGPNDVPNAWSPDGTTLLITGSVGASRGIYLVAADGSNPRLIAPNDLGGAWSPDGKRIAFTSNRTGNWELYTMNSDGTNQVRITNTPEVEDGPQWSPDGTTISYTAVLDKGGFTSFDARFINADGSGTFRTIPHVVTQLYDTRAPSFSPDGQTIVFLRRPFAGENGEHFNVWTAKADGSESHQITFNSTHANVPRWSPDGSMIAYSLQVGLSNELHLIGADGKDVRMLPQSTSNDYFAVWRP